MVEAAGGIKGYRNPARNPCGQIEGGPEIRQRAAWLPVPLCRT